MSRVVRGLTSTQKQIPSGGVRLGGHGAAKQPATDPVRAAAAAAAARLQLAAPAQDSAMDATSTEHRGPLKDELQDPAMPRRPALKRNDAASEIGRAGAAGRGAAGSKGCDTSR